MSKRGIFFKAVMFFLFCFNFVVAEDKVYRIGVDKEFPPFQFKDKNGQLIGIDVDLLKALAQDQNFKYEIKQYPFCELEKALQNDEIDAVFSGMIMTDERKNKFDFSEAYFEGGARMAVREDSDINSYNDLEGKFVAVKRRVRVTEVVDRLAKEHNFIITYLDETIDIMKDLQLKLVDACFDDEVFLNYYKKNGAKIKLPTKLENEVKCGVMVAKNKSEEFVQKINTGLVKLKENGKYQEIMDRYID